MKQNGKNKRGEMPENNTPIPDAALAELDRLHAAATPGEWQFAIYCKPDGTEIKTVEDVVETLAFAGKISPRAELFGVSVEDGKDICMTGNGPTSHINAEYIPALHNAYPALRQRLAEAESRLAEAERERDHWKKRTQPCSDYVIRLEQQAAQQRREGAAEWLGGYIRGMSDGNPGQPGSVVEILEAELKRLREGGVMHETLKELTAELAVLHESLERAEVIERQLPTYLREIEAERDQLRAEVERLRGNDAGVAQVCAQINAILDGADVFGTASEPWESTRRRVAEARKDSERLRWILCNCELVHAGKLRNGNPVYLESLEELDAARGGITELFIKEG